MTNHGIIMTAHSLIFLSCLPLAAQYRIIYPLSVAKETL